MPTGHTMKRTHGDKRLWRNESPPPRATFGTSDHSDHMQWRNESPPPSKKWCTSDRAANNSDQVGTEEQQQNHTGTTDSDPLLPTSRRRTFLTARARILSLLEAPSLTPSLSMDTVTSRAMTPCDPAPQFSSADLKALVSMDTVTSRAMTPCDPAPQFSSTDLKALVSMDTVTSRAMTPCDPAPQFSSSDLKALVSMDTVTSRAMTPCDHAPQFSSTDLKALVFMDTQQLRALAKMAGTADMAAAATSMADISKMAAATTNMADAFKMAASTNMAATKKMAGMPSLPERSRQSQTVRPSSFNPPPASPGWLSEETSTPRPPGAHGTTTALATPAPADPIPALPLLGGSLPHPPSALNPEKLEALTLMNSKKLIALKNAATASSTIQSLLSKLHGNSEPSNSSCWSQRGEGKAPCLPVEEDDGLVAEAIQYVLSDSEKPRDCRAVNNNSGGYSSGLSNSAGYGSSGLNDNNTGYGSSGLNNNNTGYGSSGLSNSPGYGSSGHNNNTGYGSCGPSNSPGYGSSGHNNNTGYGSSGHNNNNNTGYSSSGHNNNTHTGRGSSGHKNQTTFQHAEDWAYSTGYSSSGLKNNNTGYGSSGHNNNNTHTGHGSSGHKNQTTFQHAEDWAHLEREDGRATEAKCRQFSVREHQNSENDHGGRCDDHGWNEQNLQHFKKKRPGRGSGKGGYQNPKGNRRFSSGGNRTYYRDWDNHEETYEDQTYKDQMYKDQTYEDQTYKDQMYEDQTYKDQMYKDQMYKDQAYDDTAEDDDNQEDGIGDEKFLDHIVETCRCKLVSGAIGKRRESEARYGGELHHAHAAGLAAGLDPDEETGHLSQFLEFFRTSTWPHGSSSAQRTLEEARERFSLRLPVRFEEEGLGCVLRPLYTAVLSIGPFFLVRGLGVCRKTLESECFDRAVTILRTKSIWEIGGLMDCGKESLLEEVHRQSTEDPETFRSLLFQKGEEEEEEGEATFPGEAPESSPPQGPGHRGLEPQGAACAPCPPHPPHCGAVGQRGGMCASSPPQQRGVWHQGDIPASSVPQHCEQRGVEQGGMSEFSPPQQRGVWHQGDIPASSVSQHCEQRGIGQGGIGQGGIEQGGMSESSTPQQGEQRGIGQGGNGQGGIGQGGMSESSTPQQYEQRRVGQEGMHASSNPQRYEQRVGQGTVCASSTPQNEQRGVGQQGGMMCASSTPQQDEQRAGQPGGTMCASSTQRGVVQQGGTLASSAPQGCEHTWSETPEATPPSHADSASRHQQGKIGQHLTQSSHIPPATHTHPQTASSTSVEASHTPQNVGNSDRRDASLHNNGTKDSNATPSTGHSHTRSQKTGRAARERTGSLPLGSKPTTKIVAKVEPWENVAKTSTVHRIKHTGEKNRHSTHTSHNTERRSEIANRDPRSLSSSELNVQTEKQQVPDPVNTQTSVPQEMTKETTTTTTVPQDMQKMRNQEEAVSTWEGVHKGQSVSPSASRRCGQELAGKMRKLFGEMESAELGGNVDMIDYMDSLCDKVGIQVVALYTRPVPERPHQEEGQPHKGQVVVCQIFYDHRQVGRGEGETCRSAQDAAYSHLGRGLMVGGVGRMARGGGRLPEEPHALPGYLAMVHKGSQDAKAGDTHADPLQQSQSRKTQQESRSSSPPARKSNCLEPYRGTCC